MGLGLGFSKSKSKSTQDTNTNSTTTPIVPDWLQQTINGVSNELVGLGQGDVTRYVAGPSQLQQQQFGLAGQLGDQSMGWLGGAGNLLQQQGGYTPAMATAAQAGAASHAMSSNASDNMGAYFNPFVREVAGNTVNDMVRALGLAKNTNGQGATLAGQYGSNRQGVLDLGSEDQFTRNLRSTLSNLYMGGFDTAAQYGNADADRRTGVSQFNAGQDNTLTALNAQLKQQSNLANQDAANTGGQFNSGQDLQRAQLLMQLGLGGYGALSGAGATQQELAQARAQAPLDVWSMISQGISGLPTNLLVGSNTVGDSHTKATGKNMGVSAAASYGK